APDRPRPLSGRQLLYGPCGPDQFRRSLCRRERPPGSDSHRGDQQARRWHGPHLRSQGISAADGGRRGAPECDPGCVSGRERHHRVSSVKISPSILSADFARLADGVAEAEAAGADWIHVDVMDGHFVPNITIGVPVVAALRRVTKLPLDVHLMIERPERYVDAFVGAGADWLTVHQEASVHLHRTVEQIRQAGAKPGVSINPGTPAGAISEILPYVDLVLVMSVNPGFGGQKY